MSNQPSTMDNIRSTASSATQSVAQTLDPSADQKSSGSDEKNKIKDSQGQVCEEGSYQHQLDEAAHKGGLGKATEQKKEETFMEKGVYILRLGALAVELC